MTDTQMSEAINQLAVTRQWGGAGVNSVHVSRLDQWALTVTRTYPVAVGHGGPETPTPPVFPTLDGAGRRLVTALRIVCGGSVVASRPMLAQDDQEFPLVLGTRAMGNAFDSADYDRPTVLATDAVDSVRAVYHALGLAAAARDKALLMAIRRLVASGSRREDVDRLFDLMIAAEALFIQRAGLPRSHVKRDKIAAGAAAVLSRDTEFEADAEHIHSFMIMLYQARNAEMHADTATPPQLHLLDGTPTDSLTTVMADADRLMRRAIACLLADLPVEL